MIKGFKGFDQDLTCRDFQYEVGKTYQHEGKVLLCDSGFHFCKNVRDIDEFYSLKCSRICEIEADGIIKCAGTKYACSKIRIVRELSKEEVLAQVNIGYDNIGLFNIGDGNVGDGNIGDGNVGDGNIGDGNIGDGNVGDRNLGDGNSGDRNLGDGNSGDRNLGNGNVGDGNVGNGNLGNGNVGDGNVGDRNLGNGNVGDRNLGNGNVGDGNVGDGNLGNGNVGDGNVGEFCSCDNSSGIFMSRRISYEAFNKSLSVNEYSLLKISKGFNILKRFKLYSFKDRLSKEKPKQRVYLSYKESWRMFWQTLTPKEKLAVKRMPHFDAQVFYEITGIKLGLVQK